MANRQDGNDKPSPWEWLPAAMLLPLAAVYLLADPAGTASRLALFVGLGLVPGTAWRLLGHSSWKVHRIFFAVSLAAFVIADPDLRPNRSTMDKVAANWHLVALGFLVSFSQSIWGMLRIHRLLVDTGVAISRYQSLELCLSGSFFNIFLPGSTGGDLYRVYSLSKDYGAKLPPAIASVTLDRFLGLPSLILVVVMGMFMDYRFFRSNAILSGLIPFIAIAGVVCLVFVGYLTLAGKSHRKGEGRPAAQRGKAGGWLQRFHTMVATNVKRPGTLPLALFYGFLSHLACIASCQLFGMAVGVQGVPAVRYYLIVPMAMTINAIPFAPGGVGQGELAMAKLLDMACPGVGNLQEGVVIMLLFRLSNMAVGLLGGVTYAMGRGTGAPEDLAERFEAIRHEAEDLAAFADSGEEAAGRNAGEA